jgi:hypothetical protein
VTFWQTVQGPRTDGAPDRGDRGREIGAVVCPSCNNVLIRLYYNPEGIEVHCWVPAMVPGQPEKVGFGYLMWGVVGAEHADEDHQCPACWRGHDLLTVTAGDLRELEAAYWRQGRPVRRVAVRDERQAADIV